MAGRTPPRRDLLASGGATTLSRSCIIPNERRGSLFPLVSQTPKCLRLKSPDCVRPDGRGVNCSSRGFSLRKMGAML
jgi:hypothetical protein